MAVFDDIGRGLEAFNQSFFGGLQRNHDWQRQQALLDLQQRQAARQDELFPFQRDKLAAEAQTLQLDAALKKEASDYYRNGGGLLSAMGVPAKQPPGSNPFSGGLGAVTRQLESGGDPGAVNPNDGKGASYGPYQINQGFGGQGNQNVSAFIQQNPGYSGWLTPDNPQALAEQFKSYAQNPAFVQAQHDFVMKNNYQPTADYASGRLSSSLMADPRVKEVLFSLGNQHGPQGAQRVLDAALAGVDVNTLDPMGLVQRVNGFRAQMYPGQAGRYDKENSLIGSMGTQVAQGPSNTATDAAGPPSSSGVSGGGGDLMRQILDPAYIARLVTAAQHPNPIISKDAKDKLALVESIRKAQTPVKMDGMQWFQSRFGRDPNSDQEWALVKRYNQDNSTNSTNINMPPEVDETAKQQGKTLNEERAKINSEGSAAVKSLAALHYAEPLVNASGSLADMRKAVGGLLYLAGADPNGAFAKQIQEAQDINTLQALAAKLMLPIVQGTQGFHNNFSDTDLKTIMSMNVSPQNLPEVNRRLIALAREEAQLALEKQKHFKGLQDYADYEGRLTDWNEKIAARYTANPPAPTGTVSASIPAAQYKTPDDVKREYQSGKITKDQAAAILQNTFGME